MLKSALNTISTETMCENVNLPSRAPVVASPEGLTDRQHNSGLQNGRNMRAMPHSAHAKTASLHSNNNTLCCGIEHIKYPEHFKEV